MVRNAVGRIVGVGKGAAFLVGFAAILAVVFAAANALLGGGTFNNNATVGPVLGGGVASVCPAGFRDAAAKTYAANDATSTPRSDINFGIVFM